MLMFVEWFEMISTVTAPAGGGSSNINGVNYNGPSFKRFSFSSPLASTPSINSSALARSWQGQGIYTGVDNWRNITLKEGKLVVGGLPGQSNYYTTLSGLKRSNLSQTTLWQGLQVSPHPKFGYRPKIGIYKVSSRTSAAFGTIYANPQFGKGGLPQIYIPDYQGLKLIKTITLK